MNLNRPLIVVLILSLCASAANFALAQGTPPAARQSLADALRGIAPPPKDCVIAVDAAHTQPAAGDAPADAGGDVEAIAARYGQIARPFGDVVAVAPPTMTVLNTHFGEPDIYASLSAGDALKLLCATLTDSQWALLTGKGGLGASDLTGRDQKSLFAAILGPGSLKVSQSGGEPLDLTADKPLARIRVASRTQIAVSIAPDSPISVDSKTFGPGVSISTVETQSVSAAGTQSVLFDSIDAPGMSDWPTYSLVPQNPFQAGDYGQSLSMELPNTPKPSGLDYDAKPLRAAIPLGGLKTVGDLVYRVGAIAKTEIYVDPHYAAKSLTVVAGADSTAKAGDLLQALALCVTGTYRQVGPAYVLTDDLLGVGPRQQMRLDFDDRAKKLLQKTLDSAADSFAAHHSVADLKSFSEPDLAPTREQLRTANAGGQYPTLPFSALDSVQQAAAQAELGEIAKAFHGNGAPPPLSADSKVTLMAQPALQLLLPSLPDPVGFPDVIGVMQLFRPSQDTAQALQRMQLEGLLSSDAHTVSPKPKGASPKSPALAAIFADIPRRAVLLDLKTSDEVKAAVGAMQELGLNELWLTILQDGHARIPGTLLSDKGDKTDLLAEAVAAAKGTGISVYPVLDLLKWGPDAPGNLQDLTVRGENSAQSAARVAQKVAAETIFPMHDAAAVDSVAVCPLSDTVRDSLLSVAAAAGAEPGIGGVVWRDAIPPGYGGENSVTFPNSPEPLGYGVAGRLAFLRTKHADPVDLSITGVVTGLPLWDSGHGLPYNSWDKFRAAADLSLVEALRAATGPGADKTLLVESHSYEYQANWYGSWDSPRDPLPAFHATFGMSAIAPTYPREPEAQAKMESHLALLVFTDNDADNQFNLARNLEQRMAPPWVGFVLQFDGEGDQSLADFERLAAK